MKYTLKDVIIVEIIEIISDFFILVLPKEIIVQLKQQVNPRFENGGLVYGYKIKNVEEYRIEGFTTPSVEDKKGYNFFQRLSNKHNELVKSKWELDKTTMILGDWHTHPIGKSIPSSTDLETYSKNSKKYRGSAKYLFYLILSPDDVNVLCYDRIGNKIIEVHISDI